jgi:hypothetical protein
MNFEVVGIDEGQFYEDVISFFGVFYFEKSFK